MKGLFKQDLLSLKKATLASLFIVCLFSPKIYANNHDSFGMLEIKKPDGSSSYCDAVVVGKRHILTSANCFHDAKTKKSLVEFIPGFKGTRSVNPKRYLVSKAWTPKDFSDAKARGDGMGMINSNFVLLEAHNHDSEEWVGESVTPFVFRDRDDLQELSHSLESSIVTVSFQDRSKQRKMEIKKCKANFSDAIDGSVYNTTCNFWDYSVGSPVLEQVGPYFAITGLLTGENHSRGSDVLTTFGKYTEAMKDIVKDRGQNQFEVEEINWAPTYAVVVKNNCHKARNLKVYVGYQDVFSDTMKLEETEYLQPGESITLNGRSRGNHFFFRAESSGPTWGGHDEYFQVNGQGKGFKKVDYAVKRKVFKRYNDEKITLNCDDLS